MCSYARRLLKISIFFAQESDNIDFESMLRKVIEVHTQAILKFYQVQLQRGPIRVFSPEGKVVLVSESGYGNPYY